jgi:hypothetical protein
MRPFMLACLLSLSAAPVLAETEKEIECGYISDVVGAIQQARLDRVAERDVPAALAASATWPEKYNNAIPLLAGHIYELKRSELRTLDLRTTWREQCLTQ